MNLDLLRSFFAIVEHGSLNRAAEQLHVSQSTLTRQMQALEQEVGGLLLERSTSGVALTAAGHALLDGMQPVVASFDAALAAARQRARGRSTTLRIGYLMSLAGDYLHPALASLRRTHPEVGVKLLDLSPGEQIAALRAGELDLALLGHAGPLVAREFFVRRLATVPVFAVLAATHPLATAPSVRLADLKRELFVGAHERDLPGHNAWIAQLCRRAGFRPRLIETDSLTHALATVVTEGAVDLLPEYTKKSAGSDVVYRPLREKNATWQLCVAWQRGKTSAPVRAILDALPTQL
ncbi:MAG: LysR family transcriptional regulator [Verrucomicrobiota bacterium]